MNTLQINMYCNVYNISLTVTTYPAWHVSTVGVMVMELEDDDCGYH